MLPGLTPAVDDNFHFFLSPRGAMGLGGKEEIGLGSLGNYLTAIDYKTGKIAWRCVFSGAGTAPSAITGLLSTAGKLLFGSDTEGDLVAFDPANGKPLWHVQLGTVSNAPETYMLDGKQYVLVASGSSIMAFAVNE